MMMRVGVVFPQTEFGDDPAAIRDYAQTAEALGYSHILAYDHVLGANRERHTALKGPYSHLDPFHEPFVLFAFMAAVTSRIEFIPGILILPQRETALVAKQSAALDVISNARFRLGVGIGWNWVEYEALGQDFHTRGRRVEEQIEVLRLLWTQPLVTFSGRWHTITEAGLNPMPRQRPIPIWFGGHADPVLRRLARLGDGWLPNYPTAAQAQPHLDKLDMYLGAAGRSREEIGLEPRLWYAEGDADVWAELLQGWREAGATHLTLNTMRCGFQTPGAHLAAIRTFAEAVGVPA